MCQFCWIGDHGMPAVASDEALATAWLIDHLYTDLRQYTGGPLHWMLDDMNISDDQFGDDFRDGGQVGFLRGLFAYLWDGRFERYAQAGDDVSTEHKLEIQHTCEAILMAFREMPESHRAAAIAWAFGWIGGELPEWSDQHKTPEGKERIEADAREMLAKAAALPPLDERVNPARDKACVPVECPPFQEVSLGDYYAPLFANGPTVRLDDVPEELRPLAEQYIQEHGPRVIRNGDGIVVERAGPEWAAGRFSGVVAAPEGARFAPDAKITGPLAEFTKVGNDGLLHLDGVPLAGSVVEGSPEIKWAQFYGPDADGNFVSRSWTAEDIVRATTQPNVNVADVLDDPRQIRPVYPDGPS